MGYDCGIHGDPPHKGHCPYCAMYEANQKVKAILKENIMTHPLPPSLALIVKAEAEKSWNEFRNKAIPGTEGTAQSGYFGYAAFPQTAYCHGFAAAAQFLFAHLAEARSQGRAEAFREVAQQMRRESGFQHAQKRADYYEAKAAEGAIDG